MKLRKIFLVMIFSLAFIFGIGSANASLLKCDYKELTVNLESEEKITIDISLPQDKFVIQNKFTISDFSNGTGDYHCPSVIYEYFTQNFENPDSLTNAFYSATKNNDNSRAISLVVNNSSTSNKIISDDVQAIIDWIMDLIRIVGIILVIVLGILDFVKATASGEQEQLKKSRGKFVKRLIACVALFLAPIIVNFLMWILNSVG